MGVWERSPAGLEIALRNPSLDAGNRAALPDLQPGDVIGSPYCVRDYVVDARFGGPAGARHGAGAARAARARADPGLRAQPRRARSPMDPEPPAVLPGGARGGACRRSRRSFIRVGERILANGRDPYFPAWPDVVQVNAFSRTLRDTVAAMLNDVGEPVRRIALRHGDADDQRGVHPHLGRAGRRRPGHRLLARADRAGEGPASRPSVHGRGVLGHGVDPAAAGVRPLLRQAALRPARPRRRGGCARPPAGRRRLSGAVDPIHREPRRAASRSDVRSRAGPSRGGGDVDAPGSAALPRRPVRRCPRSDPRVPHTWPG